MTSADLCLMDAKEAITSAAPNSKVAEIPGDHARRVVEGAIHVSPLLGERMRSTTVFDTAVFIRELLPQDLKLEIVQTTTDEALKTAAYLATVVGFAHARQMDSSSRSAWQRERSQHRSHDLNAPSWLWTNVVGLLLDHERKYLEYCRLYAIMQEPT